MSEKRARWPKRFVRWLFGGPFRQLPPPFGSPVPPDLQRFEDDAADATRHGIGSASHPAPSHHTKTHPARQDESLERQ